MNLSGARKGLLAAVFVLASAATARAATITYDVVGAGGYDLTSYHAGEKPYRGNGNHVVVRDGVRYLFASEQNKKLFEKDPEKYLPAYGGWCAFGVAMGKKFVADPDVWEIVDGKLYLNLDNKVKDLWLKDVPGYISKADENWEKIKDKDPGKL